MAVNASAIPRLHVALQVVGSRGDVQLLISLGKVLKHKYGHRVRVATHPSFRTLAEDNGFEFFNAGGDLQKLMAYMVKNPALIPKKKTLFTDEIAKERDLGIMNGCWQSCFQSGDGTSPSNIAESKQSPFIAIAIIANPPKLRAHVVERLGIPLHLMFT
ncbi:glycosyltransferase family 1 protein [Lepidopterella palustris CBS 459.81]|uniref:Glycosyltransferase family 1 protein n=1 Tax=Lepidopterella palustris CBS 459.81 TaxID=1314670 RepID=A0A8E2E022_9PEZI|nr:glycosyltransferase family 1 protein [Lepidopterella palustris CBS 459.81]